MYGLIAEINSKKVVFMDELRKKVIEKLESDMIFCFECDEQEKAETYNQLLNLSVEEMLKYLED